MQHPRGQRPSTGPSGSCAVSSRPVYRLTVQTVHCEIENYCFMVSSVLFCKHLVPGITGQDKECTILLFPPEWAAGSLGTGRSLTQPFCFPGSLDWKTHFLSEHCWRRRKFVFLAHGNFNAWQLSSRSPLASRLTGSAQSWRYVCCAHAFKK